MPGAKRKPKTAEAYPRCRSCRRDYSAERYRTCPVCHPRRSGRKGVVVPEHPLVKKWEANLLKKYPRASDITAADRQRFWRYVDRRGSVLKCWLWNGKRNPDAQGSNYGHFRAGEEDYVASRIAWLLAHGRYPGDRLVCHTCDNPPCVNPAHLFLGTPQENTQDAVRKGRLCRGADRSPRLAIEPHEVLANMRRSGLTHAKLGAMFGVPRSRVSAAAQREGWG